MTALSEGSPLPGLAREQLVAEAAEIAGQILAQVRHSRQGSLAWLGPTGYGTELSPLLTKPLGPDLTHGTTGIALFLAAVARLRGDDGLRQLSLDVLRPLRRKLGELRASPGEKPLRLGGMMGLGSYIYGLLTIGKLLGEPELIDEAHAATVLITAEQIERDVFVRVQTGTAGAILVLLALHALRPHANRAGRSPLELALACARHLLANRISFDGRPRAWILSPGKPPLIGFGYGATGICHALLRLHGATGEPQLLAAASEGLAFVRSFYVPERGGWLDPRAVFESRYRPRRGSWLDWWSAGTLEDLEPRHPQESERSSGGPRRFSRSWCHGSAGILLGKLASLDFDDSPEVREEIQAGLEDLCRNAEEQEPVKGETDDLCCGRMGHVEALLFAYSKLGEERYLGAARREAGEVWQQARRRGRYNVMAARGTDRFSPTLFQGAAGIGYTFLRLALPADLPSVAVLES
jgi:lantibiotic modifying enzyme